MKKALLLLTMIFVLGLISCGDVEETTTTADQTEETFTTEDPYTCTTFTVQVSNGIDQVTTIYVPCLAYSELFTADGFCYNWLTYIQEQDDVPQLDQTDEMTIIKAFSTSIFDIEVYDLAGTSVIDWDSWESRTTLAAGQYYILINVRNVTNECNAYGYSVFIMNVD